jgi:hypothetical protein
MEAVGDSDGGGPGTEAADSGMDVGAACTLVRSTCDKVGPADGAGSSSNEETDDEQLEFVPRGPPRPLPEGCFTVLQDEFARSVQLLHPC